MNRSGGASKQAAAGSRAPRLAAIVGLAPTAAIDSSLILAAAALAVATSSPATMATSTRCGYCFAAGAAATPRVSRRDARVAAAAAATATASATSRPRRPAYGRSDQSFGASSQSARQFNAAPSGAPFQQVQRRRSRRAARRKNQVLTRSDSTRELAILRQLKNRVCACVSLFSSVGV